MATIFGHLTLNDSDYVYQATQGQQVIYDAAKMFLDEREAELERAYSVFVERETSDYKLRYKLPAGGFMERVGPNGRGGNVKAVGSWDVAFPLEEFQLSVGGNRVSMAYMTVQNLDLHIQGVVESNIITVRHEILKRLFNNVQTSFTDPLWGTLLVEPLANGDTVVYPPVAGTNAEATENHYLESGYAASAISDTNNPIGTIVAELEEHFGKTSGGEDIAVFINVAQKAKVEALSDYDAYTDYGISPGANTDTLTNMPAPGSHPGRLIGRSNGAWIIEWDWVPANYMIGIHLGKPKPLIRRVDPEATGLPRGLALVAQTPGGILNQTFPFEQSTWANRYGYGAGNRLNGVVMELGTGGTYSIPSDYA